jgi:predicted RNase H-like HicB family nuclease
MCGPSRLRRHRATVPEVEHEMRAAIRFHIDGLKEGGLPVPQPTSIAEVCRCVPVERDRKMG